MDNLIDDLVSTAGETLKHQRQGLVEEHAREIRRVDRYFRNLTCTHVGKLLIATTC
jgi:hypothetical protein